MKRALKRALYILLIAAVLTCFALGGVQLYRESYVNLGGISYPRDLKVLDLQGRALPDYDRLTRFYDLHRLDLRGCGVTPREYDRLRELLPGCAIIWELPFQGTFLPQNSRSIRLSSLTMEEIALLDYLPDLVRVEAWDCRDYEALAALQQRRPGCKVFYNVDLGGTLYDCDTRILALHDARELELTRLLAYLPRLETVSFTGELPPARVLGELQNKFDAVRFSWQVDLEGKTLGSDIRELDLTHRPPESIYRLSELLAYFPELESLRLGGTDLPEEALLALEKGRPGLTVFYDMDIAGRRFPRDARRIDLSGLRIEDLRDLEQRLARMPLLEWVDMSGCGIPSAEMDALDRRHEGIRFVWTVNLGGLELRTDATWFCPNKYYITVDDAALEELQYCRDLVCIDIGHMRGVTHCRWAANMPGLKYLIIADTNIRDLTPLAGLQELVFLEVFTSPVRDYRPLLQCPALEDLNLGYTYGDPTPVLQMTWLKRLWWPGSLRVLNWNVRNQLRTNLPDAKMNFVAGSSTGEGWRSGQHYYDMRDLMGMPYMTG